MNAPKVSVIIPVYNAGRYLHESLDSILSQSYVNLEILICDDGSTDESEKMISSIQDPRLVVLHNKNNQGYLLTINKLMASATGEYIAFHDADDLSYRERIATQVEYLTCNPSVALVGTNFNVIDERGKLIQQYRVQVTDPQEIRTKLSEYNTFQKPSVMFKREVFESIGGFREGFLKLKNISEDYDWLMRASEKFDLSNVNGVEPLYAYRSVSTAMSKGYQHLEQEFGHRIVQRLAAERRAGIADSMERGAWDNIAGWMTEMSVPYRKDPSLFFYERAESLLHVKLFPRAFVYAWKAWITAPWKWRNIKCVGATLKHWIKN